MHECVGGGYYHRLLLRASTSLHLSCIPLAFSVLAGGYRRTDREALGIRVGGSLSFGDKTRQRSVYSSTYVYTLLL